MSDKETLEAYATRVDQYVAMTDETPAASLIDFADALPAGGRVLDLGCGPGHAAKYLAERGMVTEAWDLSSEMIKVAAAPGVETRVAGFDDLTERDAYDGIFASFSLLHAPKADMPRHMDAIAAAIKLGGVFHLGMKLGEGAHRDKLGRFYAYYSRDELIEMLTSRSFDPVWEKESEGEGLAGNIDRFIIIRSVKRG